jgi:multicomponent K+:H+ antiporter subunit A
LSLIVIVLLPFLGALLPALLIQAGRNSCTWSAVVVTGTALLGLLVHAPVIFSGGVVQYRLDWLPSVGLNANFVLEGLGFLFAVLILGIGLLIIIYARFYLDRRDPMGQFYTYLLLFQGAMVGIVLSDNILLLLIFWELTSLTSFLLIGYWKHLPEGRQGAVMALTVTGLGGLALIAGMLILGGIAGSYDLSVILANKAAVQASPLYLPALILILLGCFTKSAQFPFHFWLPHAMAAPTPVSAYLHSATMVKAGLFLMARLWPVLSGTPEWFYLVATTGLVTMLTGAVIALFKNDLKALLAFSTVSHLGLITMLLGFGTPMAAVAAVLHIIMHATFKAPLFMVAGIIDHEAHTRDIRRLGGLRHVMPLTFIIGTLAALSMAGIPPLNGFLSKELMLEQAAHTAWLGSPWLIPALATLGALVSAAYSFRFIAHVFMGPLRHDYPLKPHDPAFGFWLAPALLVVLVVVIGIQPALMAGPLVAVASAAVIGDAPPPYTLKLWHGFTPALYMSGVALAGGALALAAYPWLERLGQKAPRIEAKLIFDWLIERLAGWSTSLTAALHNGAMTRYAAIFMAAVVLTGVMAWLGGTAPGPQRQFLPVAAVPAIGVILLTAATAAIIRFHHNRLLALIFIGVIGLIVSLSFGYLSAPDLALTQASVEVVTIILLLLALNFLPRSTPRESSAGQRFRDGGLAVLAGLGAGLLTYQIQASNFSQASISAYHLANSKPGGGGTNVVNVILVDFRGFDTFGEIIVLGIAALVIYALTESLLSGPAGKWLASRQPDTGEAGDRHPLMMVIATRVMMPIALLVAVFIFLRGHNSPGGGFIAGLVVSIALLMQYMASGFDWAAARQRFPYHGIIAAGIFAALVTGLASLFLGYPFLTSSYGYFKLPFIETFELATAMAFDAGVFLCVVGAVMLALESLSRIAYRSGERPSPHPMDVDPSRAAEPEKT